MYNDLISKFNGPATTSDGAQWYGTNDRVVMVKPDDNDIVRVEAFDGDKKFVWINDTYATDEERAKVLENYKENSFNVGKYTDTSFDDIVEKSVAIANGEEYPDLVCVTVDLPQDLIDYLHDESTSRNISVDDLMNEILIEYLKEFE